MELHELIRDLMRKYDEASADVDNNQTECMYGDVCGEFAEELRQALRYAGHGEDA